MVYDFYDNPDKIIRLFEIIGKENIPSFVGAGDLETHTKYASDKVYADTADLKFPIDTPANAYMSASYFLLNVEEGERPDMSHYGIIKDAAEAHAQNEPELLPGLKALETAFYKHAEAKRGHLMDYDVLDSSGEIVFHISDRNDVIAASQTIEDHYDEFGSFDKFAMLSQLQKIANDNNLGVQLSLFGKDVEAYTTNINLKKLAEFTVKASSAFATKEPDFTEFIIKFAKAIHDNDEVIRDTALSAGMVKIAEQVNKLSGFNADILKIAADEEEPKEAMISIGAEMFTEDEINRIPSETLGNVFGESFVGDITGDAEKYSIAKLRDAVEAMSEDENDLLKLLVKQFKTIDEEGE